MLRQDVLQETHLEHMHSNHDQGTQSTSLTNIFSSFGIAVFTQIGGLNNCLDGLEAIPILAPKSQKRQ